MTYYFWANKVLSFLLSLPLNHGLPHLYPKIYLPYTFLFPSPLLIIIVAANVDKEDGVLFYKIKKHPESIA